MLCIVGGCSLTPRFLESKKTYCAIDIGAVRLQCYLEADVNLQCSEVSLKSKNWLVQMKGCGSFLGDKWMRQSVTKTRVPLINAGAVSERQAWLAHQSRRKHKELVAFPAQKKKSTIFILPPSSLTLPHTQRWPFSLNWVTLNGGGELWK